VARTSLIINKSRRAKQQGDVEKKRMRSARTGVRVSTSCSAYSTDINIRLTVYQLSPKVAHRRRERHGNRRSQQQEA
jgi:hypothetical protein